MIVQLHSIRGIFNVCPFMIMICVSISLKPSIYFSWILTWRHLSLTVPSGSPLMFNATALSSQSIILVWEPPSPEDQNGLIVGYTINITDLETDERYQHISTSTNITIGSLTPFTTYICIIAARTNIGIGPFSTVVTVQTLEDGMCYCTFQ